MTITRRHTFALLAGAALAPARAIAQAFPTRPIRIVVPYPAGGPVDALARLLTPELGTLGQSAIVENVGAFLVDQLAGDHVGLLDQHVLVVRNDLAVRSVAELVSHAKANPGKLNYGSTGNGSASHLAMELFKVKSATDLVHVPFRGAAPMAQELVAGRIDAAFATLPSVLGQVQAGTMRALAVASAIRAPQLPEVPLLSEHGVQGGEADAWIGLWRSPGPSCARRQRSSASP